MKDFCSIDNCKTIGNALKLLFPECSFVVHMSYDVLNFAFHIYTSFHDNNNTEFGMSVYVDDRIDDYSEALLITVMEFSEMLKGMGY